MITHVAIGVIRRGSQYLIGQRLPKRQHPLKWEFPGGKMDAKDFNLKGTLMRELKEELGIEVIPGPEILMIPYPFDPANVILHFFLVESFIGDPVAWDHEVIQWVEGETLTDMYKKDLLINTPMLVAYHVAYDWMSLGVYDYKELHI